MATIKVFDVNGCKTLKCFSTLDELPYDEIPADPILEDDLLSSDVEQDDIE